MTKLLIENDCDVNRADELSKTALHYALFEGKDEIAIFLVLYGADINAKSKSGTAPIEFAKEIFKKVELYDLESIEKWFQLFKNGIWKE